MSEFKKDLQLKLSSLVRQIGKVHEEIIKEKCKGLNFNTARETILKQQLDKLNVQKDDLKRQIFGR